jgi:hypothetical protein
MEAVGLLLFPFPFPPPLPAKPPSVQRIPPQFCQNRGESTPLNPYRSSVGTMVKVHAFPTAVGAGLAPASPFFTYRPSPFSYRKPRRFVPCPPFCALSANFLPQKFGGRETLHTFTPMNEICTYGARHALPASIADFHHSSHRTTVKAMR